MRIGLVTPSSSDRCTLREVAGGFGTSFRVGGSWAARLLERAKKQIASLPPVTLGYLVALLRHSGAEVSVGSTPPPGSDVVLITSSLVESRAERQAALAARRGGALVGVWGKTASVLPALYEDVADFVVVGEVENAASAIARGDVPTGGACWPVGNVNDLDSLPFPEWDLFPYQRYRYATISPFAVTLPVLGARGCPQSCGYCPFLVGTPYRCRDPENVAAEVRHLRDRYGARAVSFREPLFGGSSEGIAALADALMNCGVKFSIEARPELLDVDLLRRLHAAGLRSLEVGIESADPHLLEAWNRVPDERHQEVVIETCRRLGIRTIANYILGLPGSDASQFRRTVARAKALNTFAVQFTVATPYPGTALSDQVKGQLLDLPYDRWDGWTLVFRHDRLAAVEVERLREWAYVSYHYRPRYAWEFARTVARGVLFD